MNAICICASNILTSEENSVSYNISMMVKDILEKENWDMKYLVKS